MARRAITMMELVETVYQWHSGQSIRKVSKSLGISRNTVKRYIRLANAAGIVRDKGLPEREELVRILSSQGEGGCLINRSAPAQALLAPHHQSMEVWLKDKDITAKQMWRLLSEEQEVKVGYTTVKRYLRENFSWGRKEVTFRLETPAGLQAQVDFGYAGLMQDPLTGRRRKAWAFIMVLSYSRHRFVRFVFEQKGPTWIDCHGRGFEFFKGVPETIVLDNLKSGVIKPDIYDPTLNRAYAECERHYGFVADPAKVRMAKHKGKVERQVRVVRQQVLAGREFSDIDEANRFALKWCREGIGMEVNGTTQRRPYELFRETEQAALKRLPEERFECPVWNECTVHPDHYLIFEKSFYSMPSRFIGQKVWVRGDDRTIRVFDQDRLVKTHPKAPSPGFRRTDESDLPPDKLAYLMPAPSKCRQQAADLGENVHRLVDLLLKEHTIKNLRKVQGILRLGVKYGGGRLDAACERSLAFGNLKLKSIKKILEKGLDDLDPAWADDPVAAMSEQGRSFIRPGAYYGQEVWS